MSNVLDACSPIAVKLTKKQAEWVSWAIDGMQDHVWSDEPEDVGYTSDAMPVLNGRLLDMSAVTDKSARDLLYRLEEQAPDMNDRERGWVGNASRGSVYVVASSTAPLNAAKLIRQHCIDKGVIG